MAYSKNKWKVTVPTRQDGQVGIRATLNNMGFSDDAIGYDDVNQTVTLNGRNLIRPGYMDENAGVSYAKNSDIQKSVADFFQNSDNPVVRVSDAYADAAGKYGLSADSLSYGNGTVAVGGTPLDIAYIDDEGKAWTRQSTVDNAAEDYANRAGVTAPMDLAEKYMEMYLGDAQKLSNQMMHQKAFSYDPDSDPVYQAYQRKYRTEGARAGENAAAQYMALTGGLANSAAATAGAQANQYYAQQLSDTIPELAKDAYARYADRYQQNLSLLDQMVDMYNTAYQNAASANERQRKNANESTASNAARDKATAEKAAALWEQEWKDKQNRQTYAQKERESQWDERFRAQDLMKNDYTNEKLRLGNEKLQLTNEQLQVYQRYYEQLLEEELRGDRLDNAMAQAKLFMLGW